MTKKEIIKTKAISGIEIKFKDSDFDDYDKNTDALITLTFTLHNVTNNSENVRLRIQTECFDPVSEIEVDWSYNSGDLVDYGSQTCRINQGWEYTDVTYPEKLPMDADSAELYTDDDWDPEYLYDSEALETLGITEDVYKQIVAAAVEMGQFIAADELEKYCRDDSDRLPEPDLDGGREPDYPDYDYDY